MTDDRSRRAVETAEQFLAGRATDEQLAVACREAVAACDEVYAAESARPREEYSMKNHSESMGAAIAARALVHGYTQGVISKVVNALTFHGLIGDRAGRESLFVEMATTLRDIFGNPFRPVAIDPNWLTPTIVDLAHGIYADRAFDRLPILSDALQDAGFENPDVLAHCRGEGLHVRGCWVVDLVLRMV
jgi:hypothetical protein